MKKPNLETMWESFVKISLPSKFVHTNYYDLLRFKVNPVIQELVNTGIIDWYSYLLHDRGSGVPTDVTDDNFYVHVRFNLTSSDKHGEFIEKLPVYFLMTRKMRIDSKITGIDETIIKESEIEKAWYIIGVQSEMMFKLFDIFDENELIPTHQMGQYLHYIRNMAQIQLL